MNIDFQTNPYNTAQAAKEKKLLEGLNQLCLLHSERCEGYAKILNTLYSARTNFTSIAELPYLPVNLFKSQEVRSIGVKDIFKTLTSSGTTGQLPSRIFLDRETAILQTKALASIMGHWLGAARLPMLIIDTKDLLKNRSSFSARGAGVVGMMTFGRDHLFALNPDMSLDVERVLAWTAKHRDQKILIFGFTFMVWKNFIKNLTENQLHFPGGILVHSGGWKKLQEEAVDNGEFKRVVKERTGVASVHNFYGMVEQIGSVFMECEYAHLHCPNFAEVLARDPLTFAPLPVGKEGVLEVLSLLPQSYPGHVLLTEDLGTIFGIDDCPCGRMGKHFLIKGRIPRAELRGCSDTFSN